MAARSVFKLISKTYSANIPLSRDNASSGRSISQPPLTSYNNTKSVCSNQKSSKSVESLRDHYKNDEIDETRSNRSYAFPTVTNMSIRDPAKEFKEKQLEEEVDEEPVYAYEVTDRTVMSDPPFFDVFQKYQEKSEYATFKNNHLQPCNLKPYGAQQHYNLSFNMRKKIKIVYPVVGSKNEEKFQSVQSKHFSTKKECPNYGDTKKAAVYRTSSTKIASKNYNTVSKHQLTRNSSTSLQKKQRHHSSDVPEVFFKKNPNLIQDYKKRSYNTISSSSKCDKYVTVKLRELQEQCQKEKKCKPKKIKFGHLPKLELADCPCIDNLPLKEGLPINKPKKRFQVKEQERLSCLQIEECQKNIRADDGYQVSKKQLPIIKIMDCPCEEREMTDFVIKRLPKKKYVDPPRNHVCDVKDPCVITTRADEHSTIGPKQLPKFKAKNCAQLCPEAGLDVPLHRLPKVFIEEPARKPKCTIKEACVEFKRSDTGKLFKPKPLPSFKLNCECQEPPPLQDAPPLTRLKKIKYADPPRKIFCQFEDPCVVSPRVDSFLKVEPKKLPVFEPSNCPCVDANPPTKSFKLKRLHFGKEVPKEKEKVCPQKIECTPRADDGLIIKQKKLRVIDAQECPCFEEPLTDSLPLKKLIPKPVQEPIRICKVDDECKTTLRADRADQKMTTIKKHLPVLPTGKCICIEPTPLKDAPPLVKLQPRPLLPRNYCSEPVEECSVIPRADEFLKLQIKKLPKLKISDCPCIEPPAAIDAKPLERLKKVHVPEPSRKVQCAKVDICEETPRADEEDWMYWRKVETKNGDCDSSDISKSSKRFYSTSTKRNTKRFYSTNLESIYKTVNSMESVDCAAVIVYQNKKLKNSFSKDLISRTVSTCSTTRDRTAQHLQPNQSIIKKKESFIEQYPDEKQINESIQRSRIYRRTNPEYEKNYSKKLSQNNCEDEKLNKETEDQKEVCQEFISEKYGKVRANDQSESLWGKVVNFFKARPDCPSPEEFKKMRLKAEAEKAAQKAGLCLYDPKELLEKAKKDLPKVITARTCAVSK